jgi:hypothetical protein
MTESDWAACNDPKNMVRFLRDGGKLSERKARLFAVACCFHCFWYRLADDRTRIAAGVAARHAEGLAEAQEVREAAASAHVVAEALDRKFVEELADLSAPMLPNVAEDAYAAAAAALALNDPPFAATTSTHVPCDRQERQIQAHILRDLFGPLPFRPVTLSASVRAWNAGTVVRLAQAIDQEQSLPGNADTLAWFRRRREQAIYPSRPSPDGYLNSQGLAVLADALEEAGCQDQDILAHCRSGGEHVRGCWVIDLLLGKT